MKTTLKGNWALDTNLLIYALDGKSPYFEKTYQLFVLIQERQLEALISSQNVTEAVNVLINLYKISSKKAVRSLENLIFNFDLKVITPLPSTIPLFFNLLKKAKTKRAIYDLFLAATLIDNKQFNLLTTNEKDFRGIEKLTVVNPLKIS